MEEENLFDDDDALDFVLYEETEEYGNNNKSGCCVSFTLLFLVIPAGMLFLEMI